MTTKTYPPFYMIRHGETDWNREKRYQGRTNVPLNAHGREQAAGNGRHLATLGDDWSAWRFFSSPLDRALETMEIIRTTMGLSPDGYTVDDRLIEVSFGTWEHRLMANLATEEPAEMALRDANKWAHVPPGGESYSQAVDRVSDFLDGLEGPAVIICHGGILRATQYIFQGGGGREIADIAVPQDRIYKFDGTTARWLEN